MKQASEDERYKDFYKIRGSKVTVSVEQGDKTIEVGGKVAFISQVRNPRDGGWQLQLTMDIESWGESEPMTEEYWILLKEKLAKMPDHERRRLYEGQWIVDEDE